MSGSDGLRVLIAPDCYGDSLTAVQAAEAIADGWRQARPDDELALAPQSDGGPPTLQTALAAHSRGVGQLIEAAVAAGARRIVVGLGGSACTDGGRGMVEAWVRTRGAQQATASVRPTRCWPTWR